LNHAEEVSIDEYSYRSVVCYILAGYVGKDINIY